MSSSPPKNTDTTSHQQTSTVPNETTTITTTNTNTNNETETETETTLDFNDPVVIQYWDLITRFLRRPAPSFPFPSALPPKDQQVVRNLALHFKLRLEMVEYADHRYIVLYKDPMVISHWE